MKLFFFKNHTLSGNVSKTQRQNYLERSKRISVEVMYVRSGFYAFQEKPLCLALEYHRLKIYQTKISIESRSTISLIPAHSRGKVASVASRR